MRSLLVASLLALMPYSAFAATAEVSPKPVQMAAGASSCSGWKAICDSRGPGCDAKYEACLKSGCWKEGAAYGGGNHCGLAKK